MSKKTQDLEIERLNGELAAARREADIYRKLAKKSFAEISFLRGILSDFRSTWNISAPDRWPDNATQEYSKRLRELAEQELEKEFDLLINKY